MRTIRMALALVAALAGATPGAGHATGDQHRGLYFHLEPGFGRLASKASGASVSGSGANLAVALGWSLGDHLALGAEWWGMIASSPKVRSGSDSVTLGEDSDYSVTGWGPKLVLYLAPGRADVFLSATPSVTRCMLKVGLADRSTRNGTGLRLAAGKEWWFGESRWGFGAAGQLVLSRNRYQGQDPTTWRTVGFGLNLSATRR